MCQPFRKVRFGVVKISAADPHCLKAKGLAPCLDAKGKRGVVAGTRCGLLRRLVLHKLNDSRITVQLADEAATASLAAKLARSLTPGAVVFLRGDLGAGKTTLVRALLRALGYAGRVKSPTYALVEQYEASGLHLRHFDLYRFRDPEEWEAAGFRDEFDGSNVCLIEWPEKAQGLLPQEDLGIVLEILPHGRSAVLTAHTTIGKKCLTALRD